MSEEGTAADYEYVKSWLAFIWLCPSCNNANTIDYDNWKVYGGLEECRNCEKAYRVGEPWK